MLKKINGFASTKEAALIVAQATQRSEGAKLFPAPAAPVAKTAAKPATP